MKKIAVREDGLVGTFFSAGTDQAAIIVLGGSSGGLSETRAEELAKQGFNALALAYFGAEHLPKTLNQIPLEYFEKGFRWLNHKVQKIGLWGTSRGAELSLILGTLFPEHIQAIAAHVPSSVVYGALDDPAKAAWIFRGKPIAPNAPFTKTPSSTGECERTAISATSCFLGGMEEKGAFAASAIPVEKIGCPLLLISAQDDQMWPSSLFAEQIADRLHQHQSPIFYTHLSYPGVGHSPSKGVAGLHPVLRRWFAYGGNPHDNAFAAADWTKQTLLFFKERLLNDSSRKTEHTQSYRLQSQSKCH